MQLRFQTFDYLLASVSGNDFYEAYALRALTRSGGENGDGKALTESIYPTS